MRNRVVSGISHRFRWLSPSEGQITHVLLTRSPLEYPRRSLSARLACVKHAASVRPEPGSNSPLKNNTHNHNQRPRSMGKKSQLPARNKHLAIRQNHCLTKETIHHQLPHPHPKRHRQDHSQQKTGHNKLIRRLFDTLLSSQESDAHRPPTSRPEQRGNLQNISGSNSTPQIRS